MTASNPTAEELRIITIALRLYPDTSRYDYDRNYSVTVTHDKKIAMKLHSQFLSKYSKKEAEERRKEPPRYEDDTLTIDPSTGDVIIKQYYKKDDPR